MSYLSKFIISFLIFCGLWILIVVAQLGNLTQSSQWIFDVFSLKESNAKKIQTKKIVLVSGSNALFGFNSARLEKHWKAPVLNDGVHAGLGLSYILYKSKGVLKRGDIAILPLEYRFYQSDGKPPEVYTDYILSRDLEYFYQLPLHKKGSVIARVGMKRLFHGLKYFKKKKLNIPVGIYGAHNVNRHGDQLNIEKEKMTKREKAALNGLQADKLSTSDISPFFKNQIKAYLKWTKSNDICVIFMPPNHLYFENYHEEKYEKFLNNISNFYSQNNEKYLGDPFSYMFQKSYYFNTAYHLNQSGIEKRTTQVIKDIGANIRKHCD